MTAEGLHRCGVVTGVCSEIVIHEDGKGNSPTAVKHFFTEECRKNNSNSTYDGKKYESGFAVPYYFFHSVPPHKLYVCILKGRISAMLL
jgi:hypothetical protein